MERGTSFHNIRNTLLMAAAAATAVKWLRCTYSQNCCHKATSQFRFIESCSGGSQLAQVAD